MLEFQVTCLLSDDFQRPHCTLKKVPSYLIVILLKVNDKLLETHIFFISDEKLHGDNFLEKYTNYLLRHYKK